MKKNIILIIAILLFLSSCNKENKENEIKDLENRITKLENIVNNWNNTSLEKEILDENSEDFKLDKKKWHFMKDLFYWAEEFYKSNLRYPKNIWEYKVYLNNKEKFTDEEVNKLFEYSVMPNKLWKEYLCYSIITRFKSEYYKKYNDENNVFMIWNFNTPVCKK